MSEKRNFDNVKKTVSKYFEILKWLNEKLPKKIHIHFI